MIPSIEIMRKYLILLLIISIFLASGCTQEISPSKETSITSATSTAEKKAIKSCKEECKARLESNINLSKGPCLSEEDVNWMIEDWVCDIAHDPREEIDNKPENQCSAYREGKASHFVELNTNCELIRAE